MKTKCHICDAPARCSIFAWRGYYRIRCVNGHRTKLATPEKAAENWALRSVGRE